ncbi:unnamed protein product [Auanema sp. JU1783]|nr:unnamed protein product [Auanema sp. JU1783]
MSSAPLPVAIHPESLFTEQLPIKDSDQRVTLFNLVLAYALAISLAVLLLVLLYGYLKTRDINRKDRVMCQSETVESGLENYPIHSNFAWSYGYDSIERV